MLHESDFERIFHKHHQGAVRHARSEYGLDYDTAEQIVADAFLVLHAVMTSGETIEHVNTWLRRNVHARYVDWVRHNHRIRRGCDQKQTDLYDGLVAVEHAGFDEVDCAELQAAMLQQLIPAERKVAKYLIQGYDQNEIARKLRASRRTIERRVATVRKKLQSYLSSCPALS